MRHLLRTFGLLVMLPSLAFAQGRPVVPRTGPNGTITGADVATSQMGKVDTTGGRSTGQTIVSGVIAGGTAPGLDVTGAVMVPNGTTTSGALPDLLAAKAALGTNPGTAIDNGRIGATGGIPSFGDARFTDHQNITAFSGANATGSGDNTSAASAALAALTPIVIPKGTFRFLNPIVLGHGQKLVCDSPTTSHIFVDQSFNPTATGVVIGPHSEPGPEIHNCDISFAQPSDQTSRAAYQALGSCTSGTGGTGCQYPWAVDFHGDARFRIINTRVTGGWNGINAAGNSGGHFMDRVEIGALNIGAQIGGTQGPALDFCHWSHIHFFPLGLNLTAYGDGSTIAANLGRCDGGTYEDIQTLQGQIHLTSDNLGLSMSNVGLDTDQARLIADAGFNGQATISNIYASGSNKAYSPIEIHSGIVQINNFRLTSSETVPQINLYGGRTQLTNAVLISNSLTSPIVQVHAGASFYVRSSHPESSGGTHTACLFQVDSGGVIDMQSVKFLTASDVSATGCGVGLGSDDARNVVANNDLGGWGLVPIAGSVNAQLGPNNGVPDFTFTPTLVLVGSAGSPAFNPTYGFQEGRYHYTANGVEGTIALQFNTNAYGTTTAASGGLSLGGLPFSAAPTAAASDGSNYSAIVKDNGLFQLDSGFSTMRAVIQPPSAGAPNILPLRESGSGVVPSQMGVASVPLNVNGYTVFIDFKIPRT